MNGKQYNNVIDYTVKHEQTEDSLATARAVFNNMGVALPEGDLPQVAETLKSNDYMYWRSCTMQEAQEAANNGTPAIGISDQRIVLLAATDEEQPVATTAAVMTLTENTPAYAVDGMRYYAYGGGTVNRAFSSSYLINQWDSSIVYPSGEQPDSQNRAFEDTAFYSAVCGKSGASGTIARNGCGICCLAMYLLYKSNQANTNNNTYHAVKAATIQGTNENAALYFSSSITYGGETVQMSLTNNPDDELNAGNCCIFFINDGDSGHFVLAYGISSSLTGTDKYFVADPDGGRLIRLSDALDKCGLSHSFSHITRIRVLH